MARDESPSNDKIPAEIRDACADLFDAVVMLHVKWRFYRELFREPEHSRLLSNQTRAFFQIVEESLRSDMLMSICRLSDPSLSFARLNLSFAILRGKCADLPKVDNLVTAFQAACGNVRLYRNRYVGHNDLESDINLKEELLPGVGPSQMDEILRLAREILRAIYGHYANVDLTFDPVHAGGARELITLLKTAQQSLPS